jgi:hypothetical protein
MWARRPSLTTVQHCFFNCLKMTSRVTARWPLALTAALLLFLFYASLTNYACQSESFKPVPTHFSFDGIYHGTSWSYNGGHVTSFLFTLQSFIMKLVRFTPLFTVPVQHDIQGSSATSTISVASLAPSNATVVPKDLISFSIEYRHLPKFSGTFADSSFSLPWR